MTTISSAALITVLASFADNGPKKGCHKVRPMPSYHIRLLLCLAGEGFYSFSLAGEGAPLSWRPSADAVAGNGPPLMRRPCADAVAPRLGWRGTVRGREPAE